MKQSCRYYIEALSTTDETNQLELEGPFYYSLVNALEEDRYCFSAQNSACTENEENVEWIVSEGDMYNEGYILIEVQTTKLIQKGKQIFAKYLY